MNVMKTSCSNCSFGSCAIVALSSSELRAMEKETWQADFSQGAIIRVQNDPVDAVIYLRSGFVKEYARHQTMPDQVIQIIKPRSYIGLHSLCTDTTSAFSYQAISEIEICFIRKTKFSQLIRGNGHFAREIIKCLSTESMSNHRRFLSLNRNQTYGKVAGLLLYLSEEIYGNRSFGLQLKRAELAQLVASTRESITRALRWLHTENVINMDKNHVTIVNFERLSEIARHG